MPRIIPNTLALIAMCLTTTNTIAAQTRSGTGQGGRIGTGTTTTPRGRANNPNAIVKPTPVNPASHLAGITKTVTTIDTAIAQAPPADLTKAQKTEWAGETRWLNTTKSQLTKLADKLKAFENGGNGVTQTAAQMNSQFQKLQQQLAESSTTRDKSLTGADKARHAIALNAIRNMK